MKRLIYLCVAAFCLSGCAQVPAAETAALEEKGRVDVYIGDELYQTAPFGEAQTIVVDQGAGMQNTIELTGETAHMLSSTCDTQDCVQQSEVGPHNYQQRMLGGYIICLPHGLVVEYVPPEAP